MMNDVVIPYRSSTPYRCCTETFYVVLSEQPITGIKLQAMRAAGKLGWGQEFGQVPAEPQSLAPEVRAKIEAGMHAVYVRDFCDSSD